MQNRSRNKIISDILELLETPRLKTSVMFKASLSYSQLKSYHKILLEKGLVEEIQGKWVSTDKGRAYLEAYRKAARIIEETAGS